MICAGQQDDRMEKNGRGGVLIRAGEKTTTKKPFTRHGLI